MHTRKLLSFLLALLVGMTQVPAQAAPAYNVVVLGKGNMYAERINVSGWVSGVRYAQAANATIFLGGNFVDLGDIGADSYGVGINYVGDVAGWVESVSGHRSAAIFSNGKIKVLGTLQPPIPIQAGFSEANDINNAMQVVGRATANARRGAINRPVHAFLYDGSMHDLGTLGGANSVAVDINEAGQIVGNSDTAGSTTQHAFIYANGFMTDMGSVPGFPYLIADSINNLGQATGTMLVSAPFPDGPTPGRAFLYENGVIHQLPLLPNTDTSWAGGINDNGQIVGRCGSKAFLYSGGVMTDLGKLVDPTDVLPLKIVSGVAINNAGQILAYARSRDGSPGYWYLRLDPVSPPPPR